MRAARAHRRPALQLHRSETPSVGTAPKPLIVIQNAGMSDTVRLVVLGGDPLAPQRERPGIAVVELHPGTWSAEEQLEIIEFFRERAEAKWTAHAEQEARITRFMLRLAEDGE